MLTKYCLSGEQINALFSLNFTHPSSSRLSSLPLGVLLSNPGSAYLFLSPFMAVHWVSHLAALGSPEHFPPSRLSPPAFHVDVVHGPSASVECELLTMVYPVPGTVPFRCSVIAYWLMKEWMNEWMNPFCYCPLLFSSFNISLCMLSLPNYRLSFLKITLWSAFQDYYEDQIKLHVAVSSS